MKIQDIQVFIIKDRTVLVKVFTDEGIVGIGECSPMHPKLVAETIISALKPIIVGLDPFDIERISEDVFIKTYKFRGRLVFMAFSGIEIAIWDAIGKALKLPVYKLLGGEYRKDIKVYASFMRRDQSPKEVAERAEYFVNQGFKAIKIKIGKRWGFDDLPDNAIETVKEVRKAVGYDIDLMVDCNSAYSAPRAIQIGRKLEEYNIFHFEEPVPEHDIESLRKVSEALDVPVAAGEQNCGRYEFKELIVKDALDIVQPDVIKAGGFLECKKIATLADSFGKVCTPHNTQPNIGTVATLHFIASTPNCRYPMEYNIEPHPLRDILIKEPIIPKDGYLTVPEGHGLGIEVNEEIVEKYGVEIK